MRLNVRSKNRNKEEDSRDTDTGWEDWTSIQDTTQSRARARSASIQLLNRFGTSKREDVQYYTADDRTQASLRQKALAHSRAGSSAQPREPGNSSDELYLHNHDRDSLVDNLLSSFDVLAGQPVEYSSHTPTVHSFPAFSAGPASPELSKARPQHSRAPSEVPKVRSTTGDRTSFDRFDPYAARTTKIRLSTDSTGRTSASNNRQPPKMDPKDDVPSLPSSRPVSSVGTRHGKSRSKASNKSTDMTEKAYRRRSQTLGPASGASILNRSRPVPGDYHNFHDSAPTSVDRPTIIHRGSEGPSTDEYFKPQISSRGKVATLTGTSSVLASQRVSPKQSRDGTLRSSRQPSAQVLGSASSSSFIRPQPSTDSSKGKPGFFRRVFGSSKPSTPRPTTPTYQLPPLSTGNNSMLSTNTSTSHADGYDASKASSFSKASSTKVDEYIPPAPAVPASNEPAHVVQKKASFFRRRKKSVSDNLAVDTGLANTSAQEPNLQPPSPSSLRQAMGPFLAQEQGDFVSPTETVFHESREQQSREGMEETPFKFAPAPRPSESAARVDYQPQRSTSGNVTSPQDFSFAPEEQSQPRVQTPKLPSKQLEPLRIVPDDDSVSTARSPVSTTSSTHTVDLSTSNKPVTLSSKHMRTASTTAQLTGSIIPEHHSDEDWVDTTPFKRPNVVDTSKKSSRVILDPDAEDEANGYRDAFDLVPDTAAQSTIRAAAIPQTSAQRVPTLQTGVVVAPQKDERPVTATRVNADDDALAKKLFNEHDDPAVQLDASTVLGQANKDSLRRAYVSMFDFCGINILLSLRDLCRRLALKGETQQVDRVIGAFSERWCTCNPQHGFKSVDVVHTICYSILLLNTDLHIADVENKMTRQQFIKNTASTILAGMNGSAPSTLAAAERFDTGSLSPVPWRNDRSPSPTISTRPSIDGRLGVGPQQRPTSSVSGFSSPSPYEGRPTDPADLLVNHTVENRKVWETQLATVLREFYQSIRANRLPLHSGSDALQQDGSSSHNLSVNTGLTRRGSIVSQTGSTSARQKPELRGVPNSWNTRNRSKQRFYHSSTFGSSNTSFEDQPIFSPSASSTWSRSFGRAGTTMSSDSLASAFTHADYGLAPSIGFASALSNAIIREEEGPAVEDENDATPMLDDESLGLEGAPWAKEGIVHHKHHLEAVDKRAKNRDWVQCFAVVGQGRMRLFSFPSKSTRKKSAKGGAVVGGGNWMDNAEELGSFTLRQTLANELPPPGYSKQRPHVFALMLPTGGLHLFQVGTPEIATEFVSTANYWSARLSKEPLVGGVSNVEYGWSENVLNAALLPPRSDRSDSNSTGMRPPSSARIHSPTASTSGVASRSSFQGSVRGASIDLSSRSTARMPGDKVNLTSWTPPQHSLMKSGLREGEQLDGLQKYISDVEDDLRRHNELRGALDIAYSRRSPNHAKAMQNWERKSSYLLKEIVKFRTYADALIAAGKARERVYEERAERSRPVDVD